MAATVEPDSRLTIFARTVGRMSVFREGKRLEVPRADDPLSAEEHDPVTIPVLPGDLVTVAFDTPYSWDEDVPSFVIALNARYESRDLTPADLRCDLSANPGMRNVPTFAIPLAKKLPNPPPPLFGRSPDQDEALRAFNAYFELPKTTHRSVDVPCLGDMIGFLREFDDRKLAPTFVGTETSHFAVVIRVPEE
jgi:hypothetical protein